MEPLSLQVNTTPIETLIDHDYSWACLVLMTLSAKLMIVNRHCQEMSIVTSQQHWLLFNGALSALLLMLCITMQAW